MGTMNLGVEKYSQEQHPRVAVVTLGCKVNQCDTAAIGDLLADRGFVVVPFGSPADCYIVNTCTVTGRADYQSRQLIRRARRADPHAVCVVTGCYAHRHPEMVARIPGVAAVVTNDAKADLPAVVERLLAGEGAPAAEIVARRDSGPGPIFAPEVRNFSGRTRAFLKIQDGCDAFCSYCAVPYARGGSRSLPPEEVLRRITNLGAQGYKEIVLTGIHLGGYGRDLDTPVTLTDLLRRVEAEGTIPRLRLSSIELTEITDDFMDVIREARIVCPHLHIPLQSGDDAVLEAMNRHYSGATFCGLVEKLIALRPDMAVGVDVMAGFPGEDEGAFANTLSIIEHLPIAYLHVFPFSRRPGTPAALMDGQVSEEVKKRRVQVLKALGAEKRESFLRRHRGRRLRVLLECVRDRRYGAYRGFSDNYIPVVVPQAAAGAVNTFIYVWPERCEGGLLIGKEAGL